MRDAQTSCLLITTGEAHRLCHVRVRGLFTESSHRVTQFQSARSAWTRARGDRNVGETGAGGAMGGPGSVFEAKRSAFTFTGSRLYKSKVRVLYKVVCWTLEVNARTPGPRAHTPTLDYSRPGVVDVGF